MNYLVRVPFWTLYCITPIVCIIMQIVENPNFELERFFIEPKMFNSSSHTRVLFGEKKTTRNNNKVFFLPVWFVKSDASFLVLNILNIYAITPV